LVGIICSSSFLRSFTATLSHSASLSAIQKACPTSRSWVGVKWQSLCFPMSDPRKDASSVKLFSTSKSRFTTTLPVDSLSFWTLKLQSSYENDQWFLDMISGNTFIALSAGFLLLQPYIKTFFLREWPWTSTYKKIFRLSKVLFEHELGVVDLREHP